ncbi:SDR family oxidoreductase [Aliarcobacter butzleri]|uniref:SDR family oxidoreductase n=1 Tax=Aliarcobacter butzleri TaxID=28197 RepID=UPI00344E4044
MKTNIKNTILITGGASGIGYEFAKQLSDTNNVIIAGRNKQKLEKAKEELKNIHIFECDVSNPREIESLYKEISDKFPNLNILINNAGLSNRIDLQKEISYEKLTEEMNTNFNGSVYMTTQFLPLLKKQKSASIINVTSALAYVPFANSPIYSASKAALHSFTQSLRIQLKDTNIKVFEIAPSVTKTQMLDSFSKEEQNKMKIMTTETLVGNSLKEINKGTHNIGVGETNALKIINRISPSFAINMLNKRL